MMLTIYSGDGNHVITLPDIKYVGNGFHTAYWDGNREGQTTKVGPGSYKAQLTGRLADGSYIQMKPLSFTLTN